MGKSGADKDMNTVPAKPEAQDKPAPTITVEIGGNKLSATPPERTFSSGKRGYGVYEKVQDPKTGRRFQFSVNMVELQPK